MLGIGNSHGAIPVKGGTSSKSGPPRAPGADQRKDKPAFHPSNENTVKELPLPHATGRTVTCELSLHRSESSAVQQEGT